MWSCTTRCSSISTLRLPARYPRHMPTRFMAIVRLVLAWKVMTASSPVLPKQKIQNIMSRYGKSLWPLFHLRKTCHGKSWPICKSSNRFRTQIDKTTWLNIHWGQPVLMRYLDTNNGASLMMSQMPRHLHAVEPLQRHTAVRVAEVWTSYIWKCHRFDKKIMDNTY